MGTKAGLGWDGRLLMRVSILHVLQPEKEDKDVARSHGEAQIQCSSKFPQPPSLFRSSGGMQRSRPLFQTFLDG